MITNQEKDYQEWFKKAEEDELSIRAILKEGGAPSTACFLSQQLAEKYLKGFLVFHNKEFRKVHDLLELERLVMEVEPKIKEYEKELDLLNTYYFETRYPGNYPEFTLAEAEQSFEAAKGIKDFILKKINNIINIC